MKTKPELRINFVIVYLAFCFTTGLAQQITADRGWDNFIEGMPYVRNTIEVSNAPTQTNRIRFTLVNQNNAVRNRPGSTIPVHDVTVTVVASVFLGARTTIDMGNARIGDKMWIRILNANN
ncbi:MAG: hypothetical protein SNJ77_12730 [Cytophagales bacterium]